MRAESRTLKRIFEQSVRYCVPLFQRPYVWSQAENWAPLWEDVRRLAEQRLADDGQQRTHFIGAIVLEQLAGSTGSIETRQIIDGQQRLTSLQVILTVLKDICRRSGMATFERRFEKFSRNEEAFIDQPHHAFKVWPTNPDRVAFQLTLEAGEPEKLRQRVEDSQTEGMLVNEQIPKAYLYFYRTIQEWLNGLKTESNNEQLMDSLWLVLSSQLRLVTIDLELEDDAQVIFETLNSRGAPLLPGDLVKNYLFRRGQADGLPVEKLYEEYWRPFDKEWWREEMRQGRLKRPRLDIFLQHYLSLKTRDDVLVTHIFETYKLFAEETSLSAEVLIQELCGFGKVFQRLVSPHPRPRIDLFLKRLVLIDTATVYPFLLGAFRQHDNGDGHPVLEAIVSHLESFLVRRMVCQITAKNYNRFFLEMMSYCEANGGINEDSVVAYLHRSNAETARWPSDEEFRAALIGNPLYTQLTRPKLRMILRAIDAALQNQKSEDILLGDELTIEHLLPQSWKEHWPLQEMDEAKQARLALTRDVLKHSLGNLTLLTQKLNSSVSKGPWVQKRPEILKHAKLNMNRAFHEMPLWDEAGIRARSEELAELAVRIWPRPPRPAGVPEEPVSVVQPESVISGSLQQFQDGLQLDAHSQFQQWRREHPDSYFLTAKTQSSYVLHHVSCRHVGNDTWESADYHGESLTKQLKVCSTDLKRLEEWAIAQGVAVRSCKDCLVQTRPVPEEEGIGESVSAYLAYWKPEQVDWENPASHRLDHAASQQFYKVCPGDRVYLLTSKEGVMYLLGRILVGRLTDQQEAARLLNQEPDELWEADYHILAQPNTAMPLNPIECEKALREVFVISAGDPERIKEPITGQRFQSMREINADSADLLDDLIAEHSI